MIKRILVADDSETIQKAINIALAGFDAEIFVAASYVEALGACRKYQPELLIVDASLTGTDGTDDFQKLAEAAGRAPLLLLEGSYEPVDHQSFEALGLKTFLKKPFGSSELLKAIEGGLGLQFAAKHQARNQPPLSNHGPSTLSGGFASFADMAGTNITEMTLAAVDAPRNAIPPPPLGRTSERKRPLDLRATSERADAASSQTAARTTAEELYPLISELVRQAVEQQLGEALNSYVANNFKSLTRELIQQELRLLAEERSRHLVDN